jgi:hypothetical protein
MTSHSTKRSAPVSFDSNSEKKPRGEYSPGERPSRAPTAVGLVKTEGIDIERTGQGSFIVMVSSMVSEFAPPQRTMLAPLLVQGAKLNIRPSSMNPTTSLSVTIIEGAVKGVEGTLHNIVSKVTDTFREKFPSPKKQQDGRSSVAFHDEHKSFVVYSNTDTAKITFTKNGKPCSFSSIGYGVVTGDISVNVRVVKAVSGHKVNVYVNSIDVHVEKPDPEVNAILDSFGLPREVVETLTSRFHRRVLRDTSFAGSMEGSDLLLHGVNVSVEPVSEMYNRGDEKNFYGIIRVGPSLSGTGFVETILKEAVAMLNTHLETKHGGTGNFFDGRRHDVGAKNDKDKTVFHLPTTVEYDQHTLRFKFEKNSSPFIDSDGSVLSEPSGVSWDSAIACLGFNAWSNPDAQIAGVKIVPVFVVKADRNASPKPASSSISIGEILEARSHEPEGDSLLPKPQYGPLDDDLSFSLQPPQGGL